MTYSESYVVASAISAMTAAVILAAHSQESIDTTEGFMNELLVFLANTDGFIRRAAIESISRLLTAGIFSRRGLFDSVM